MKTTPNKCKQQHKVHNMARELENVITISRNVIEALKTFNLIQLQIASESKRMQQVVQLPQVPKHPRFVSIYFSIRSYLHSVLWLKQISVSAIWCYDILSNESQAIDTKNTQPLGTTTNSGAIWASGTSIVTKESCNSNNNFVERAVQWVCHVSDRGSNIRLQEIKCNASSNHLHRSAILGIIKFRATHAAAPINLILVAYPRASNFIVVRDWVSNWINIITCYQTPFSTLVRGSHARLTS